MRATPDLGHRADERQRPDDGHRAFDLLVAGDAVPDVIVGDVAGEIAFGQAETLVERGALTVGGSSAIMACGAARLGLRVAFVGVVGDDAAGRFMLDELTARGVDVSGCVVLPGRATGLTVHLVRPGAERDRAMLTSLGCVGELTAAMVRGAHPEHARHLHVGSFYLLPRLAPDLAALFARGSRGRVQHFARHAGRLGGPLAGRSARGPARDRPLLAEPRRGSGGGGDSR